jgi:KaiC/GvpD/RAD55 family RecA-like ATPase
MDEKQTLAWVKYTCPYCDTANKAEIIANYPICKCKKCKQVYAPEPDFHEWRGYVDRSVKNLTKTLPGELSYPIKYLQDALGGITPSELVVIGAAPGVGKTEIANAISFTNAKAGKRISLFSLEGDEDEVINRERYKRIAKRYYESGRDDLQMNYRNFINNKLFDGIAEYLVDVDTELKEDYKTLKVYNRRRSLTLTHLIGQMEMVGPRSDLIVIDHLHYFEYGSENEHAELTKIIKTIQLLKTRYRLPIVLVSHLHRMPRDQVFPDKSNFHGSSNIEKQANTCILLAPVRITDGEEDEIMVMGKEVSTGIYPTGIRIAKDRYGTNDRLLGIVNFDRNTKMYDWRYYMGLVCNFGVKKLPHEFYPKWADGGYTEENPFG